MKNIVYIIMVIALSNIVFLSSCDKTDDNVVEIDKNEAPIINKDDDSQNGEEKENSDSSIVTLQVQNLNRAIILMDAALKHHFEGDEMKLFRFYNAYKDSHFTDEKGSVWMYTAAIEATNSILEALDAIKLKETEFYKTNYEKYLATLDKLYDGLEYYAGTYTLTSYTQTKEWTIYGVDRSNEKGRAEVRGVHNVYDDQEWLICECLRAYNITGNEKYREKAEYLTSYVLDGWDCDYYSGEEIGGITWGPAYVTKHACSNAPLITSLVKLSKIYKDKSDNVTYLLIEKNTRNRIEQTQRKNEYYLAFAEKIYSWQKRYLKNEDGVYADLMEVSGSVDDMEVVDGNLYRKGLPIRGKAGAAWSYNSGTMLSGAAELYHVTHNDVYLTDFEKLTEDTYKYFSRKKLGIENFLDYASVNPGENDFRQWFNDVLLTGYISGYSISEKVAYPIDIYQKCLDYAWNNYRKNSTLPTDLISGWKDSDDRFKYRVECINTFAFVSEYAQLSCYEVYR